MDAELQATCSALGYMEGTHYIKEPDCIETVKDLIRFLRRDNDICDIRRQLGHAQIMESDLIPLVKFYSDDKPLFETVIKLMVNLTQPVLVCFNNQIPDEKTLRNYCLEVESHLQESKEAFIDEIFFGVIADKIKDILKMDWDQRREEDRLQLERLFVLVRNILMVPGDPAQEQCTDDDASIHDRIIWALHTTGIEDLILYMASSDTERGSLCMHIMEIVSLMFREQEAETLASAGVQRSTTEKERDQRELENAREKERQQKKANIIKFSGRHSRFGGTFVIQNMKSISENDVIYHKPLCEAKNFSYDQGKVKKKLSKNRAPIRGDGIKRRSTLSMRLSLKEFCVQFLVNAYNPLMRAVRDCLTRKSAQDNDETYFLWAMRFFMEFCRLHCKRMDLVSETMSLSSFHYIYTQLCTYYENVQMGKVVQEARTWGRRTHLALKAYQELLKTLDSMSRSSDEQIQASSKVIQGNVFYMMEYRDIFVMLLKKYNDAKCSRAYLRDLVESTHVFLKMLENFTCRTKHLVVQKKKRAGRGKVKKSQSSTVGVSQTTEPSEEELAALWESEVSSSLSSILQGREELPDTAMPFDAASEVDLDDQRIEAMLRVQASLRNANIGEAVGLFRAAREVWPEREEFGSEGMGEEEEFMALREIFMTSLPRPQGQTGQMMEETEGIDEMNEAEEEEREEMRTHEEEFNFKSFINDFAHMDVIKSYAILLSEFAENSDSVNHAVVKMLHRLTNDLGYVGMLFQASVFQTFRTLLLGRYADIQRYKELSKFACYVIRKFAAVAKVNKKVFVDMLFWKTRNEALVITGEYDFNNTHGKCKVMWKEHEELELQALFEKYRDAQDEERDTVDLIMGELTSSHTRVQVLKELKRQGLITSVKDIKKSRKKKWSDEEIQELRNLFDTYKDSNNPAASITDNLSTGKSKNMVINKILELQLVDDRHKLLKQRSHGRRGRKGNESPVHDGRLEQDDSDEGDRLFPGDEAEGRRNRGRRASRSSESGSDDDSADEGSPHCSDDDDDDEDVVLVVRQTASTVEEYINRLVENGYSDQIAWIQRVLRSAAEDREEGVCVATPIVPLTEESETAMEDEIFLIFLRSIGMTSPVSQQEMFWRIPGELSASDLSQIADGLDLSDISANAPKIIEIQNKMEGQNRARPREKVAGKAKGKRDALKKLMESKKRKEQKKKGRRSVDEGQESKADRGGNSPDDDASRKTKKSDRKASKTSKKKRVAVPDSESDSDQANQSVQEGSPALSEDEDDAKGGESDVDSHTTETRKRVLPSDSDSDIEPATSQKASKTVSKTPHNSEQLIKSKKSKVHKKKNRSMDEEERTQSNGEGNSSNDDLGETNKVGRSSGKRSKKKRITLLDSESESDQTAQSVREGSPALSEEEEGDGAKGGESDVDSHTTQTRKRVLPSDSDSDIEPATSPKASKTVSKTPRNPQHSRKSSTKKTRFILSDDEEEADESGNPGDGDKDKQPAETGKGREDSDKENTEDKMEEEVSAHQSQNEESLKLHFDTSSDDDANEDIRDKQRGVNDEEQIQEKGADSFPATLFTMGVGSDEDDQDDDHIPLRVAMDRKQVPVVKDKNQELS